MWELKYRGYVGLRETSYQGEGQGGREISLEVPVAAFLGINLMKLGEYGYCPDRIGNFTNFILVSWAVEPRNYWVNVITQLRQ